MTFQELLDELAEATKNNKDKGTQFEKLIANYLLTDPQYADRLADVWLWDEWPDLWATDVGIDLVARERGTGESPRVLRRLNHLRGLSHEQVEQVLTGGA